MPDWSKFSGIPFVDRGRDPVSGLDCWGLFSLVMLEFGVKVPDYSISCFAATEFQRAMRESLWMWEEVEKPEPGVAVALAIHEEHPKIVQHVGVCINRWKFIHTLLQTGVIITPLNDSFYRNKIKGFYKWRGQK